MLSNYTIPTCRILSLLLSIVDWPLKKELQNNPSFAKMLRKHIGKENVLKMKAKRIAKHLFVSFEKYIYETYLWQF